MDLCSLCSLEQASCRSQGHSLAAIGSAGAGAGATAAREARDRDEFLGATAAA